MWSPSLHGHRSVVTGAVLIPSTSPVALAAQGESASVPTAPQNQQQPAPEARVLVATSSSDRTVRIWSLQDAACLHVLRGHTDDVLCLDVAPGGRLLVSGGADQTCRLWDLLTREVIRVITGHSAWVTTVRFATLEFFLSGSLDHSVRVWSTSGVDDSVRRSSTSVLPSAQREKQPSPDRQSSHQALRATKSSLDLPGGSAGSLLVPPASSARPGSGLLSGEPSMSALPPVVLSEDVSKEVLSKHRDYILALAVFADLAVCVSRDRLIACYRWRDGQLVWMCPGRQHGRSWAGCVAFSPDGQFVAVGCFDGHILVLNARDGAVLRSLWVSASDPVTSLTFADRRERLACGLASGQVAIVPLEAVVV
jgi:WD40 repeat protein